MATLSVFIGLAAAALAVGWAARLVARDVDAVWQLLAAAPLAQDVSGQLPEPVRAFALKAGAVPDDLARSVVFGQEARMVLKPDAGWQTLNARQIIAVGAVGFAWDARQPVASGIAKFRVLDAYHTGSGRLDVWLLGLVRMVKARGAAMDRGEAIRYLAELPWAPDAILGNPALSWSMPEPDWAEVSTPVSGGTVTARFRFDANGDIVEMRAPDRPTTDAAGAEVLRDWQGYFGDYRWIGARRIPAEGEVGYVGPDGMEPYFQGQITEYAVHH